MIWGLSLLPTWGCCPALGCIHRSAKSFWFRAGPKIPSRNTLCKIMTAGVTTADGKSREWTPWHCLSFSELYCMGWIGPKVKNQKSKAWAVKIRFIVFLTLPLKRTFLFQELLIRLKKKERKTRGEENMLHYPYEESCAALLTEKIQIEFIARKPFPW